jgi:hypothetical protein
MNKPASIPEPESRRRRRVPIATASRATACVRPAGARKRRRRHVGCHAGAEKMKAARPRPRASPNCWSGSKRRTIPRGRTTSRNPCARPSARCASACACAARHRPVGLGLLRLRADLHLAFLWRQALGRLCAVQLGNAGHRQAVRGHPRRGPRAGRSGAYDAIVVTNLCVPTASGVPLRLLPKRSTACASSASTCRASACRPMPKPRTSCRRDAEPTPARKPSGPCRRRAPGVEARPTVTLLGEMFPADPVASAMLLEPMGLAAGPVVPTREWRELYAALDCAVVAAIHPFYTARSASSSAAGRKVSARRRSALTAPPPG